MTGFMTFPSYDSESEPNIVTGIQTCFLRCSSSAHYPLHLGGSPIFSRSVQQPKFCECIMIIKTREWHLHFIYFFFFSVTQNLHVTSTWFRCRDIYFAATEIYNQRDKQIYHYWSQLFQYSTTGQQIKNR